MHAVMSGGFGAGAAGSMPGTRVGTLVLIVDPDVKNADILLAGLQPGLDLFRLAPGGRGLKQIADRLAEGTTTMDWRGR